MSDWWKKLRKPRELRVVELFAERSTENIEAVFGLRCRSSPRRRPKCGWLILGDQSYAATAESLKVDVPVSGREIDDAIALSLREMMRSDATTWELEPQTVARDGKSALVVIWTNSKSRMMGAHGYRESSAFGKLVQQLSHEMFGES